MSRPADGVRRALRVDEAHVPELVLLFEVRGDRHELLFLGDGLEARFDVGDARGHRVRRAVEVFAAGEIEFGQHLGDALVAKALVHLVEVAEVFVEAGHELGELFGLEAGGTFAVADDQAVGGALDHDLHELGVVLDVLLEAALLDAIERRLRDVDVAALDELLHVAEEEGQQQGADVRAVHVGIGHQDDFAVAQFGGIEIFLADAAAEGGDHGSGFPRGRAFCRSALFRR